MARYNLVGIDGNAYAIIAYVTGAMRREGKDSEDTKAYQTDAMSGDYNHLLAVSAKMVAALNEGKEEEEVEI